MKKTVLCGLVAFAGISIFFGTANALQIVEDNSVVTKNDLAIESMSLFSAALSSENDISISGMRFVVPQKNGDAYKVAKHIIGNNRAVDGDSRHASALVQLKGGQRVKLDCERQQGASAVISPDGYENIVCRLYPANLDSEPVPVVSSAGVNANHQGVGSGVSSESGGAEPVEQTTNNIRHRSNSPF